MGPGPGLGQTLGPPRPAAVEKTTLQWQWQNVIAAHNDLTTTTLSHYDRDDYDMTTQVHCLVTWA